MSGVTGELPPPRYIAAGKPTVHVHEAGIFWKAIASPSRLNFSGTSLEAVSIALRLAFGEFPIRLGRQHLPILQGMAAASSGAQPYKQLYEALNNIGELELTKVE